MDPLATMGHTHFIEPVKDKNHIYDNVNGPVQRTHTDSTGTNGAVTKESHEYEKMRNLNGGTKTAEKDTDSSDDSDGSQVSTNKIKRFQRGTKELITRYNSIFVKVILLLLLVGYTVYFVFALRYSVHYATALIVMTSITVFLVIYKIVRDNFGETIYNSCMSPVENFIKRNWRYIKWILFPAIFIGVVLFLTLDVIQEIRQLQSLSGMVVFISLLYVFSKHPDRVDWRPVIVGFSLQFVMGVLVLRWSVGYQVIDWMSGEITTFINYSMAGAASVFGDPFLLLHPFVFVAMPMLVYIGAVMSIMYYLGLTQVVASKVGWFMQLTLGTTAIESLSVGANIFLNGMDTMLMLRNYLPRLTKSEFHCFLVGNHSTVAGFAFAIFVMFGAPPQHLLSAAVMSAPAAIAVAKLSYPETEESTTKTQEDVELEKGDETNVIEAGANGAAIAGTTVSAVVVNFIGFLSLLAFVNATLSWMGGRVGYPELSFEIICSYLFMPVSLIMGVEWSQCREVAKLVGIKVFTSEVIAYQELGTSIKAGLLDDRSASIATYALCGFSGLSTLAIAVGVWNAVCPSKTQEMARQMFRVIVNANISCFMTACIAGLMYNPNIKTGVPPTDSPEMKLINSILGLIPSYKDLMDLLG